ESDAPPTPPTPPTPPGGGGEGPSLVLYGGRNDKAEAASVVSIIKDIGKDESVAVLCRSRPHLASIIGAFKAGGIRFRARKFDPLSERPVAQDLLAVLRSLLHPYDRVAWLAMLRAPWTGLTLPDIHALCLGDKDSPVWRLINDEDRLAALTGDGRARIYGVREKYRSALGAAGTTPMRRLLEGLWIDLGGPACYEDASTMSDAEAFMDAVGAVDAGAGNDPLKSIEDRLAKLYAAEGGAGANVEIMTVHNAKGLEFDHVIMPGLGRWTRGEDKKLILWAERGADLLLAPIEKRTKGAPESRLYNFLAGVDKEKARLESVRLLYVGATRARKRLYLLGHAKVKEGGGVAPDVRSLLAALGHMLSDDMMVKDAAAARSPAAGTPAAGTPAAGTPAASPHVRKRLPASWAGPALLPAIPAGAFTRIEPESRPVFDWAGESAKQIGTVAHGYLCRIAEEGVAAWGHERVAGEEGRMNAMLRSLGLSAADAREKASKCAALLCKALSDERGRWILEAHPEGAVEHPVSAVVNGAVEHSVIDRTFVDETGCRWIIDYKTGGHEGGALTEFLASEKERYAPQLERYAAALAALGETREIRKGLYYPALSGWIEW
ncbi:MAG: PD-(D/E)XK nuclease family protein, partial [Deltaproteobacteria bacterium]|nr:PD-(D/E)XK nuclease family protein [Deltaproteobacteria bacterium]